MLLLLSVLVLGVFGDVLGAFGSAKSTGGREFGSQFGDFGAQFVPAVARGGLGRRRRRGRDACLLEVIAQVRAACALGAQLRFDVFERGGLPLERSADAREFGARVLQVGGQAIALSASEEPLYAALRSWRARAAKAQSVPPYVIFHDRTLAEIAAVRPTSRAALERISGVGESKLARYGEAVLEVVRGFDG